MDLQHLAEEYGATNLRFFVPMSRLQHVGIIPGIAFRNSNDLAETVECTVDESRYAVKDGYKITLKALDPMYGKEHYYQSDLESIICANPDTYRVFVLNIDGYQQINSVVAAGNQL